MFFIAFISFAFADDYAKSVPDTTPQVTGTGAIAEICRGKFVDPTAQTACEVYTRMSMRDKTEKHILMLEYEITHLEAKIIALEDHVAALEAAQKDTKK